MNTILLIIVCCLVAPFSLGGVLFVMFLRQYLNERKETNQEDTYSEDLILHLELQEYENENPSDFLR